MPPQPPLFAAKKCFLRTFISQCVTKNINMTVIKKIVGHKSIMNLTERIYTHVDVAELLEAVNKL